MKKVIVIALCLCLLLCGCAPSFSASNGSVLDKEFIQNFPFHNKSIDTAVDWFKTHDNYKIKSTDESNNTIEVSYSGNIDWHLTAHYWDMEPSDLFRVDGYFVLFTPDSDYSEQDWLEIYNCAVNELTDLCGNPVKTSDGGNRQTFHHGKLEIKISYDSRVTLEMTYKA